MAVLDKKGRLFGRLNIIDCVAVLLIIALAAAAVYRFTASGMTKNTNCRIRYTLVIRPVRDFTLDFYDKGLSVYDKAKQEYIGDVDGFRFEPYELSGVKNDGTFVMAARPEQSTVYLDIAADARETDTAFLLNGAYELKVGSEININTKYVDVTGTVVSAEIIEYK
ncbi:MAG: DUF4330 domain-containing protein [Clostridiales bacterium]|jgi:hypothetical protein|nr:DUF4330 domain-containing protein [Clostridiales bacterium]